MTSFEKCRGHGLSQLASFQDLEIKRKKRNFHVTLFFLFSFVVHLITLKITIITSTTSSSMSVRSRTEIHLMSLAGLMKKNNFFIQNKFRLDHFLFKFSSQRMLRKW